MPAVQRKSCSAYNIISKWSNRECSYEPA